MNTLQERLFDSIKAKCADPAEMVDRLAALLQISKDSVYRRLKGEKPLMYEELCTLVQQFNLSLDALSLPDHNTVIFRGSFLEEEHFGLLDMLRDMAGQLGQLAQLNHPELYYVSKDIPVFYYLKFPAVTAFKFFVWLRTQFRFIAWRDKPFTFDIMTAELQGAAKDVVTSYSGIPSIEILNADNILNDLRQLEYYFDTKVISDIPNLRTIYDALHEMVEHMEKQAADGRKNLADGAVTGAPLRVYVNDFYVGDNTVLAVTDEVQRVFLNHAAVNFMATDHPVFVQYNLEFIRNLIRRSTLISEVGERTRARFFHLIQDRIRLSRIRTLGA